MLAGLTYGAPLGSGEAGTVEGRWVESREHRDLLREKRQGEARMGRKLVAGKRKERAGTPNLQEVEKEREKLNALSSGAFGVTSAPLLCLSVSDMASSRSPSPAHPRTGNWRGTT